ncbi:DUF3110 domain-containing protein [Desulfopila aestuarii]|uniref:Uncharacterized protein n=1 Tax=Desulfopila aestuarii DSM 18488 TaxID=1121416 RepID=A0A1M7YAF7_9BACT|nr:DUF3110 domain-containing protein [Desulfopila aestuarii]SHO49556.1 Protein of unknown function [Desulfopila aestuarii DSM 18488]
MTVEQNNKDWVYVFVGKEGDGENLLGLYDETTKANFIPTFANKDDAQECFLSLPREKGKKYEVQAVHIEELNEQAEKNNFLVAMVDKDGKIIR